jgi:hypothetical protein
VNWFRLLDVDVALKNVPSSMEMRACSLTGPCIR